MDEAAEATGAESPDGRSCYLHADRRSGVTCQRCDRPICPQCMHQASVGFHCQECARAGSKSIVWQPPTVTAASSDGESYWVTKTLMGLSLAGFALIMATGGRPLSARSSSVLLSGGLVAHYPPLPGAAADGGVALGEYYRLITSAFLHDGIFHLAFNLYALWLLGQLLELAFGVARFICLYSVSLFGGALGVMLVDPRAVTVGASGAIFGLLAAMVLLQRAGGRLWRSPLGMLLVMNMGLTLLVPGISIGGHFGGLMAGFLMGWVLLELQTRNAPWWATGLVTACLSAVMVTGAIAAASQWREPVLPMLADRLL